MKLSDEVTYKSEITMSAQLLTPLLEPKPSVSLLQETQSRVRLHTSIYVVVQSYHETEDVYISVDEDDEMELIEEINVSEPVSGIYVLVIQVLCQKLFFDWMSALHFD